MPPGSVSKRCGCRDGERRLGARCPDLRRASGTWSSTHGSWGYQLELPPTADGRRRQLRHSGFDTRGAAITERDQARSLLELADEDDRLAAEIADMLQACRSLPDRDALARRIHAGVPATATTTVGEYLWQWHAGRNNAASTLRDYAAQIRTYLVPHLGDIPIQDLKARHIGEMFAAMNARNTEIEKARACADPDEHAAAKRMRPVSAARQQRIRATLRKALNDAIYKERLIEFNPAVGIELPSGARPKARVWTDRAVARWRDTGQRPSPVMVWTPVQAGAFLDYAKAHDPALYPMFVLIVHRGLRRGEACGLRDDDVDLDAAYATILQQITAIGHRPVTTRVKSDAGERVVPLGPHTVEALGSYLARRARWRELCGEAWPDTGLFFVQPDGAAWHPQTVSARFRRLVKNGGLPPVRLHDLRHGAATYLRHGGADLKEVQETLGHASIAFTSDTYTSVIVELHRASAEAAERLIPRKPTSG